MRAIILSILSVFAVVSSVSIATPEEFLKICTDPNLNDSQKLTLKSMSVLNESKCTAILEELQTTKRLTIGSAVGDLTPIGTLDFIDTLLIARPTLNDISPLAKLVNLKNLTILNNDEKAITPDLSPLSHLDNLQELKLWSLNLSDLTPLSQLRNLRSLELDFNKISDIGSLSSLTSLTSLSLGYNPEIKSLQPISNFKQLQYLKIDGVDFSDLEPLNELREVWLVNAFHPNKKCDVSSLKNKKKLEVAEIFCDPADVSFLSGLINLRILSLIGGQLKTLDPISHLTKLVRLEISGKFQNLIPLSNLTQMQSLYAGPNLTSIEGIEQMKKLWRLDVRGNKIESLAPVAGLENLIELWAGESASHKNTFKDLEPVSHLPKLRDLDITGSEVSDVTPLAKMERLHRLFIKNSKVLDLSPLKDIIERGLIVFKE